MPIFYPGILLFIFFYCLFDLIGRTAIGNTQLQISIALVQYGVDHLPQKVLRRLISRNQNADARLIRELLFPLARVLLRVRKLFQKPVIVTGLGCVPPPSLHNLPIKPGEPVLLYIPQSAPAKPHDFSHI